MKKRSFGRINQTIFVVNQAVSVVPATRNIRFTLKYMEVSTLHNMSRISIKTRFRSLKTRNLWFSAIQRSGLSRRAALFDSRYNLKNCGRVTQSSSISKRIHSKTAERGLRRYQKWVFSSIKGSASSQRPELFSSQWKIKIWKILYTKDITDLT